MKNIIFSLLTLLTGSFSLVAQISTPTQPEPFPTHSHAVSASLLFPVGEFSDTHIAGLSLGHAWSRHRFGTDSVTHKKIGFIVNSGVEYLLGKEVRMASFDFRFGNYFSFYSMPGLVYHPVRKGLLYLNCGPFLAIYEGNFNLGFGGQFGGQYNISQNIAIGPALSLKKRPDTNTLWFLGLRGIYAL